MDARINHIFWQITKGDKSFTENESFLSLLFGGHKYSQSDMRSTWLSGIKWGLEQGLFAASLEGQKIEINNNIQSQKHKEFYEKFLELASEYNCQIQYHPQKGMCVIDLLREHL